MTPALQDWDAIIVGSGAGGAAAAWRLSRAGLRVLVLEKGARLPRDGSTLDVARVITRGEFQAREPWIDGAGRPLVPEEHYNVGGKTRWYGAALLRYDAHEFAADPGRGLAGWPLAPAVLAPYYEEAESLLGVTRFACEPGLARIVDALVAPAGSSFRAAPLGLALSPAIVANEHEARHFDGFASVLGLKGDAECSLLDGLHGGDGFTLLERAEVVGLLAADCDSHRIAGVVLRDGRRFRARAVLLAAGALHSPRLLARYLRAQRLDRSLPCAGQVGRHLKLHLLTAMVAIGSRRQDDLLRKTMLLTSDRHPHSSVQPLGFDADLIANLIPRSVPRALAAAVARRSYGFFLQTEDSSHPDNRVIDEGASGCGLPVLDYDERRSPDAAREHREFIVALRRALWRAGFVAISRRIGLAGTAHACGTLMAGTDATRSVVDADGRVHGLEGLYVVDGSTLPRSSRVNPSLTIYAWALRVAARLLETRAEQHGDDIKTVRRTVGGGH